MLLRMLVKRQRKLTSDQSLLIHLALSVVAVLIVATLVCFLVPELYRFHAMEIVALDVLFVSLVLPIFFSVLGFLGISAVMNIADHYEGVEYWASGIHVVGVAFMAVATSWMAGCAFLDVATGKWEVPLLPLLVYHTTVILLATLWLWHNRAVPTK